MTPRAILVYYPDEAEARAYAELIQLPQAPFTVRVAWAPEEAADFIHDTEILYAWRFPASLLRSAPRLQWIQSMGAGVERFLVPKLPRRVLLTRAAGIFGPWMAEYTIAWCLWTTQRIEQFRTQQRQRRWAEATPARLRGATLCLVGLGDVGRAIARAARALGMRVIAVTRGGRKSPDAERTYRAANLRQALAQADFVVLTVPLTPTTHDLVGARELASMKPSAWLVNVGRGPVVDEDALIAALRDKRIAGAVLDVFNREPLPPDHPLWTLDNVAITPHISGPSIPAEIAPIFNDNLRRYVARRPLRHVVDRTRGY